MISSEQERIEQNVQRTVGLSALRRVRAIVDADLRAEAARGRMLGLLLRYGWIALLPAAWLLARYLGVI